MDKELVFSGIGWFFERLPFYIANDLSEYFIQCLYLYFLIDDNDCRDLEDFRKRLFKAGLENSYKV